MALVQELVHLHGGSIQVESQPGMGTTFTITIPLGMAHLPADHVHASQTQVSTTLGAAPFLEEAQRWLPADESTNTLEQDWLTPESSASSILSPSPFTTREAGESPQRRARILLADDNADLRDYLTRLLSGRYEVEAVGDGAAALQAARRHPPDLVLSDVMMPELDGFGLLRALRADPRTRAVPVILLSARAGEEATIEGLQAGANDYLIKPFSAREVLARIASQLEIARLRQETTVRAGELEAVFEAMTAGIDIVDARGIIHRMNQAGYQLAGLNTPELVEGYFTKTPGERAQMLAMRDEHGRPLPPKRAPAARVVRGETLAGSTAMDVQVHTLDGREREWEFSGAPIRDGAGVIRGGVVMFHDVTERRALARRTADSLAALLKMAQTLVEEIGSDHQAIGNDTEVLPRIVRLIQRVMDSQYTAAALVTPESGTVSPLAVVGVAPEVETRWWRALSGGNITDFLPLEMAKRLYAGEMLTLDLANQPPIPGLDYLGVQQVIAVGVWVNPQQICLLGVEIRNRQTFTAAEKELMQAATQLMALVLERRLLLHERAAADARALASEEAARRMDEFLGIASHELRTPLTSIIVGVQTSERQLRQLLENPESSLPEQARGRLERTHNIAVRLTHQLKRVDRLVGDLLDVTRITAGKLDMRLEPCDLREIVREVVEAQRAIWPERTITLALPSKTAVPLIADADRLGQVVTNYLTNALKYSDPEQPVAVQLTVQKGKARVTVRDHGPGLPADQLAKVFERFYRVPGVEQRSGSGVGLGLGLYICQTIIRRHGGQVSAESVVGKGSTFSFTLPLPETTPPAPLP